MTREGTSNAKCLISLGALLKDGAIYPRELALSSMLYLPVWTSRFGLQTREDGLLVRVSLGHAGRRVLCAIAAVGTIALIGCSGKTNQRSTPPAGNKDHNISPPPSSRARSNPAAAPRIRSATSLEPPVWSTTPEPEVGTCCLSTAARLSTQIAQLSEALVPQETLKGALLRKELETTASSRCQRSWSARPCSRQRCRPATCREPRARIWNRVGSAPNLYNWRSQSWQLRRCRTVSACLARGVKATDPYRGGQKSGRKPFEPMVPKSSSRFFTWFAARPSDSPAMSQASTSGLVGRNAPEPDRVSDEPIAAGSSWLVEPANRGQIVSRLDITVRNSGPGFADALGKARADRELEEFPAEEKRMKRGDRQVESRPERRPQVHPDQRSRACRSSRAGLRSYARAQPRFQPKVPTLSSNRFESTKGLACDPKVVTAKRAYDKAAGSANVFAMAGVKPAETGGGSRGICRHRRMRHVPWQSG